MAIALPGSFKNKVVDVSPQFWRVQVVLVSCQTSKLLLINSYFPNDDLHANGADIGELLETLEAIRKVIVENSFDSLLWMGDLNAEFLRNSQHCAQIKSFANELGLIFSWEKYYVDFTYCQEINNELRTATLDHFLWNSSLDNQIIDAGVIHSPDNVSDHEVIYCVVKEKVDVDYCPESNNIPPKPKWNLASETEKEFFRVCLDENLAAVDIPQSVLSCTNVQCKDDHHIGEVDSFVTTILEKVDISANSTLPLKGPCQSDINAKSIKPGWSEYVAPFRDKAYFWHSVWKSAGRPINCQLHSIMKKTRNVYHFHIRKIRKSENLIKKNRLLEACLNGKGDIFKEIRRLRKCEPKVAS